MMDRLHLKHYVAPLSSSVAHDLVSFLRHKGVPWIDDIRRRVRGDIRRAEDHYFLALDQNQDRIVGHVWYTVARADPRLGVIGHVYTDPEFRRKGISKRLLQAALDEFLKRGGTVTQLFTSTPFTIELYEQLGFENLFDQVVYHERDWYMRYPVGAAATIQQWFAASDLRVRDLEPSDLPQYCLLFNADHDLLLKDRAQQIGFGLEAELAFIDMLQAIEQKRGLCLVLDNGQTIAGTASLAAQAFPHQSHIGLFDFYTCPIAQPHALRLAGECLLARDRIGIEKIYAISVDDSKKERFLQLGFVPRASLPNHYRISNGYYDCQLLEWSGTVPDL